MKESTFHGLSTGTLVRIKEVKSGPPQGFHYPENKPLEGEVGSIQFYQKRGYVTTKHKDGAQKFSYLGEDSILEVPENPGDVGELAKGPFGHTLFERGYGTLMGSDPEVFALSSKGEVIPAWEFLPSKITSPRTFWDGFQAEFTTAPVACHEMAVDEIQKGLSRVNAALQVKYPSQGALLTWKSVVEVPSSLMEKTSEEHSVLGCSPSENAYDESFHMKVERGRDLPIRFAGMHIHLGMPKPSLKEAQRYVKVMDAIAGVCSVAILKGMEDPRRRRYYGLAGEFRLPPHGLEYRTPSSSCMAHPVITHLIFDLTRAAFSLAVKKREFLWNFDPLAVQEIVNTYDVEAALALLKRNGDAFKALLEGVFGPSAKKARLLIEKGALEMLPLEDMEKNWKLGDWGDERGTSKYWSRESSAKNCKLSTWDMKG